MSKKTKSLLYNLLGFAIFFIMFRFAVDKYTEVTGIWVSLIAFVISTLLAPKFQAVNTKDGEKLFMSWVFLKGVREIN